MFLKIRKPFANVDLTPPRTNCGRNDDVPLSENAVKIYSSESSHHAALLSSIIIPMFLALIGIFFKIYEIYDIYDK